MPITIYDYDFKTFGRPYFYDKLKEIDCLIDMNDYFRFRLIDTEFYIFLTYSSFVWVHYPDGVDPKIINLEELMDLAPKEIIEKLMYHIDVLKHEKKIRREA